MKIPCLYIVVPCYNEADVLPLTAPLLVAKLQQLAGQGKINPDSRVLFVDDGSKDKTWDIIEELSKTERQAAGIRLSRNRGHQNAVLAGLMEAKAHCDITISIDADGQDDLNAMDKMVNCYADGCEIVYGVRSSRKSDTFFKRTTAQGFYRLMRRMGADTVYNHADYRLVSSRVLDAFADFKEVNIFLRGMFPLAGFKSTVVEYKRTERLAGKTHYTFPKMLSLALNGITSLSVKPLRLITTIGVLVSLVSFVGLIWAFVSSILGGTVRGWASTTCMVCFIGGIQLLSLGVIGEYVGKIYMEVKRRPRYIISERTDEK